MNHIQFRCSIFEHPIIDASEGVQELSTNRQRDAGMWNILVCIEWQFEREGKLKIISAQLSSLHKFLQCNAFFRSIRNRCMCEQSISTREVLAQVFSLKTAPNHYYNSA